MKNLFKIIACLVVVLQLILLYKKGHDLIYYDLYLGLPEGSYGYPVPYPNIITIFCLIASFILNILALIIKKKNIFYHTLIAFSIIYMVVIGYDLYLHRYSDVFLFKGILLASLVFLIFTLLIPKFNDLNAKLNIYMLGSILISTCVIFVILGNIIIC